MATITHRFSCCLPVKWSLHSRVTCKGDLRPDELRQNLGGNLLLKAILTDVQFWIPVAVLAVGVVLLAWLR